MVKRVLGFLSGLSSVPSICSKVVLPAPEGPTIETISAALSEKEMSFSILVSS